MGHVTARLDDGSTVRGTPEAVGLALDIQADMNGQTRAWVAALRQMGVKAAHPNDGWIKRDHNQFSFEYPQFNDGFGVGDLVAFGHGWDRWEKTWIVRVTGGEMYSPMFGLWRWHYEFVRYMVEPPRYPKLNLIERVILRPFGIKSCAA